jgi:hypothetical protein
MNSNPRALLGLLLPVFLLPMLATADTGPFIGAAIGSSHIEEDFSGISLDSDATAYRFVAGFLFGDIVGIEAGYHSFGDFSETIDVGGLSTSTEIRADGWTAGGTLGLPVSEQFSLFARAGIFVWEADVEADGFSVSVPGDENPYYGGGAKFDFTRNLSLIADWTRYELDPVESDVISIGFQYRFAF